MRHDRTLDELWDSAEPAVKRFEPESVRHLPPAVQRYFLRAFGSGAKLSLCARLRMKGSIKLKPGWCSFVAEQVLRWDRGFVWSATAKMNGLPVTGFDRLVDGDGAMRWKLLGLFPVMAAEGAQVARAAAGRLHAEAIWIPAALLGDDVRWTEVAPGRVRALIDAHNERSELELELDDDGKLRSCSLQRWGDMNTGEFAYHAFGGTAEAHGTFHGITIPTQHRVGWMFGTPRFEEEGEFFRCTLTDVEYR